MSSIVGVVGFLAKKNIQTRKQSQTKFISCEYLDLLQKYSRGCVRAVTVYRPPPSKENSLKENNFLDEFPILLEQLVITSSKLLIAGDFSIYVNKPSETYAKRFLSMLKSFNLKQHVSDSTHNKGNTRSTDNKI